MLLEKTTKKTTVMPRWCDYYWSMVRIRTRGMLITALTPLHLVSLRPSNLDVARIMLDHGADIDVEDEQGRTPLQVALIHGQGKIARLLSEFRSVRAQT